MKMGNCGKRKLEEVSQLGKEWNSVSSALANELPDEWDPDAWSALMAVARAERNGRQLHRLRVMAAADTVRKTLEEQYRKEVMDAAERTSYKADDLPVDLKEPVDTEIEVWKGDCLAAGLHLQDIGFNPVVLNMANQFCPGGGWGTGDGAQEENLFRRTSYWVSLVTAPHKYAPPFTSPMQLKEKRDWSYPLGDFSTVYSPDVLVLKGTEAMGYPMLKKQRKCAFVASACYANPKCGPGPEFAYPPKVREGVLKKILSILNTALVHGHDAVVLSAFGCGAFNNPPNQMAAIFKEALESKAYKGQFKKVVFAIFNDHNAKGERNPCGNIKPFEDVFGTATLEVPTVL